MTESGGESVMTSIFHVHVVKRQVFMGRFGHGHKGRVLTLGFSNSGQVFYDNQGTEYSAHCTPYPDLAFSSDSEERF